MKANKAALPIDGVLTLPTGVIVGEVWSVNTKRVMGYIPVHAHRHYLPDQPISHSVSAARMRMARAISEFDDRAAREAVLMRHWDADKPLAPKDAPAPLKTTERKTAMAVMSSRSSLSRAKRVRAKQMLLDIECVDEVDATPSGLRS